MTTEDLTPPTSEPAYEQLTYERRGSGAWITLDRPEKRNALTSQMVASFAAALDRAEADRDVRAVVITGRGSAFCAGADLTQMSASLDARGLEPFMAGFLRPLAEILLRLRASALPIVAAVNGACAAGGLELVLCCDFVLAADTASYTDAHAQRGIAPAIGGAAALVDAIGSVRATALLMRSDPVDAVTMHAWGLVTDVVAATQLDGAAADLVDTIACRSPHSLETVKRMVQRRHAPGWAEQVAADLADFEAGWGNPDMREGLAAYVERRAPQFRRSAPPPNPTPVDNR